MSFGSQSIEVDVVAHHHANLDSFPFRYGLHFNKTTSIKLFNCKNYKWQKNGEIFEVEASFQGLDNKIENGLFILAITDFPNPRVVTVMRNDVETEFFLSKLLKSLRESGEVTTNDFLAWHPLYLSGEANTFEKLAKLYAAKTSSTRNSDASNLIARAKDEARNEYQILLQEKENEIKRLRTEKSKFEKTALEAIDIYKQTESELAEKNEKLVEAERAKKRFSEIAANTQGKLKEQNSVIERQDAELKDKDEQLKKYKDSLVQIAKQHPQYDGSEVELSAVGRLKNVEKRIRTKSNGSSVNCVFLQFEGNLPERKMDEIFDPQDLIFEKAKKLIGEKVVTITWRPEIFRATHWFRDIFIWNSETPAPATNHVSYESKKADVGTYLNCPYDEKDECKGLGGRWDPAVRRWYVPAGKDLGSFSKWLEPNTLNSDNQQIDDDIPF